VKRSTLRPESQDSPGSVSTGKRPLRKISKAVAPRDTRLGSWRELLKSNLLCPYISGEKEFQETSSVPNATGRRTSPDHESGPPIIFTRVFHACPRGETRHRRSLFKPILRCKRESSPRNVPAGESTQEKKGGQQFFSHGARVLF
jgi:hypothetical protein